MATSVRFDTAAFDAIRNRVAARLAEALLVQAQEEAADVVDRTLETWPVETGESARAWREGLEAAQVTRGAQGLKVGIQIENDADHAAVVEYGDSDTPPGGHLQRAIRQARDEAPARLQALVRKQWGGG